MAKNYSPATRDKIERALRWGTGDIERILEGGEPARDGELQYIVDSWPGLSRQVKAIIIGMIEDALSV